MKKRNNKKYALYCKTLNIALVLMLTLFLTACSEEEGPAEQAGEEIDETIQQLETDTKDAKQELEEKTEEIINDTERAVEDATD